MSKNAWLTLDSIPSRSVQAIQLPNDEQWCAQFLGAFLLLTEAKNWEQFGILTPDEMAQEWLEIFQNFIEGQTTMIPVASIMAYAGATTPPDNFLFCDGARYNKVDYPELYAIIGETYGGNGTTKFDVPDLRDRVVVGLGVTGDADVLGEKGGKKNHTLVISELPIHTHVQNSHNHTQDSHNHGQSPHNHGQLPHGHTVWGSLVGDAGTNRITLATVSDNADQVSQAVTAQNVLNTALNVAQTATNQATTPTSQNTGGDAAHNNMQPYLVLNYIIRSRP